MKPMLITRKVKKKLYFELLFILELVNDVIFLFLTSISLLDDTSYLPSELGVLLILNVPLKFSFKRRKQMAKTRY